ncbi:MAG: hypothetical protein HFG27_11940 [Provencibacterium sp.]|jgi:hypothetical protein|nr:hypothetical protein [Provencibacterium sp.]
MKRLLSALLGAALLLAHLPLPVFAAGEQDSGALHIVLQTDYQEPLETLQQRGLSLTLSGEDGAVFTLPIGGGSTQELAFGGEKAAVYQEVLNPQNAPLAANDKVGYWSIEISGLPLRQKYQVSLQAEGYGSLTTQPVAIDEYLPQLFISAQSGGFALGDATGDRKIDESDLQLVADSLKKAASGADLNRDGKVNIADIALVHHHMGQARPEEIYEGALVTAGVLDMNALDEALKNSGIRLEGKLQSLFSDDGQTVALYNEGDGDITLPITFKTPKLISEMDILSPAADGAPERGQVLVEYEDGSTEQLSYDSSLPEGFHATERVPGQGTVVIRLGKRVPVKKITITVEKVFGEDGRASFALIEKIEFLKDIIPDNLDLGASIPKDLQAQAGAGLVSLSWRAVDNVDGYIVKYGTSAGALNLQLRVGGTEAVVSGLKNLTPYYFAVCAYSGDWTGKPSGVLCCIPQPDKAPLPPDNLALSPQDSAITLSWKKTENAEFYNVYMKPSAEDSFQMLSEKQEGTSFTAFGLTNGVSYDFYVTAGNAIGMSAPSLTASGSPEPEELVIPTLPTRNRIDSAHIIGASMQDAGNLSSEIAGSFSVEQVYDGDFSTYWRGQRWGRSTRFTFEFDEEQSMDYLIYVPRLSKGYPESIGKYSVTAYDKDGNATHLTADNGQLFNNNAGDIEAPWVRNNPKETGYAILPFTKNDHIKKLSVLVRQVNGSPHPEGSLAEIAFYSYDDIDERIAALFTGPSYTELAPGATQQQIEELRAYVQGADGYYVNQSILLDELALAESLLKGERSALGAVADRIQSRDSSGDKKSISTLQPLGVTAEAGKQIVVYADIPQGESLSLIPTQHFAEAARWSGPAVLLERGRNIITIPRINDVSPQKGGPLYLQYSGSRADEIRLQVRGGTKIPVLELSDWHELGEGEIKARMSAYIEELSSYCGSRLSGLNNSALTTSILNATEISLPHVLLSLPASQVKAGIGSGGTEALYNDALAWEELMQLMYRTHGIDETQLEASRSRHNIRYMRMFGNAFMYAGGNHIGIGFGSCSGMLGGRPTSVTGQGNANGLFGWGIQHEIGHVMDSLGKAEITNNIYSLFAQTYDGGDNALPSRLEKSNKYERIFEKVTSGQQGMANDVFVSLGMYWQLHLAYDGADDNFYSRLNQLPGAKNSDAAFMAAASQVAGRDLSDFFKSWGFTPSGQSGEREERKIQYLTDESRRARMAGTGRQSGTVGVSASYDQNKKQAAVTIVPTGGAQMLGYEINRTLNGKTEAVAFLSAASGQTVWTDTLGSVNNKAVTYSVKAVDILGYVIAEASAEQLQISHDNLVSRSAYSWSGQDGVYTASFTDVTPVAGIRFSAAEAAGQSGALGQPVQSEAAGQAGEKAGQGEMTLGASGAAAGEGNILIEASADGEQFTPVLTLTAEQLSAGALRFFTREGADGSICSFEAKAVRITGLPAEIATGQLDFAAYPGDYIEFGENGIGILAEDYGEIKAGTLIITGAFRGNPVYNTIRVYGRGQTGDMADGELSETQEVPLEGTVYLFAALPEQGDMAEIDNGFWVFVPDLQSDASAGSESCEVSLLPTQIMAQLLRTDIPQEGAGRIASYTKWIPAPTYESMPKIKLEE